MESIEKLNGTDIYLLDQIMKGAYQPGHKILDVGCGYGRNMRWFADNGFDIFGCDQNTDCLIDAQDFTKLSANRFCTAELTDLPYEQGMFDHVICNAVLHFAASTDHFMEMVNELHHVLKSGGVLFVRMTSTFGLPNNYAALGNGRFLLQDGSERFLLTKELLNRVKGELGFVQIEPVKSVLVEELRSMTTLVLQKQ